MYISNKGYILDSFGIVATICTSREISVTTMHLKWKLFPLSKPHKIELFKSCMKATTAG